MSRISCSFFVLLCFVTACVAADTNKKATPAPKPVPLAPILVDPVHDGDKVVSGYAPLTGLQLTVKLNGVVQKSKITIPDDGKFVAPLAGPAQAGNYVELSATRNGIPIHGDFTVLAAAAPTQVARVQSPAADPPSQNVPAPQGGQGGQQQGGQGGQAQSANPCPTTTPTQLSAPSITPAQEGQRSVEIKANSSDLCLPGLQLSIQVYPSGKPTTPAPAKQTCIADSGTGACSVLLAQALLAGDAIQAQESASNFQNGPFSTSVITVPTGLGAPTISSVQVFLNANDQSKANLQINVKVLNSKNPVTSGNCSVTAGQDNCTVTVSPKLAAGQTIHAWEVQTTNSTTGPPGPIAVSRVQELGYDWGRARTYFSLGAVFSRSYIPTSSSTTTGPNFSSPDVFAGLDMDFNWYTSQKCQSYRFADRPPKIATLISAVNQCSNSAVSTNQSKPPKPDQPQPGWIPAIQNSMRFAPDQSMIDILNFISQLDLDDAALFRLRAIADELSGAGCTPPGSAPDMTCLDRVRREAFSELAALRLTADEVSAILTRFDFETTRRHGWLINSYFDARLTQTSTSNGFALASSPNSAHIEGGLYAPFYFPWSRWPYAKSDTEHALFMAPIAKLGFDSLRGSATDELLTTAPSTSNSTGCTMATVGTAACGSENLQNAIAAVNKDVFRMMAFGGRFGFFALAPNPNREPDTISYIDFTYGRFDNFFVQKYNDALGRIRYPSRLDITGRLKVPATPFFIGMDINKGVGPDAMSIFVGARTDLSSLLEKLIPTTGSQ